MRCEEAQLQISAGLDGELREQGAAPLSVHLSTCETCRIEQAALAGTVQLLRELPETDPPAELRRRIGVALLEEERRSQRRHLGWAWLARPRPAGWAWGAAAGAMLAAVALVTTRGGSQVSHLSTRPHPLAPSTTIATTPLSPHGVKPVLTDKPSPVAPGLPVHSAPKPEEQRLTATLPPVETPSVVAPPPVAVIVHRSGRKPTASTIRLAKREPLAIRKSPPHAVSPSIARGLASKVDKAAPRPASTDRDAPKLAGMNSPASMPASGTDLTDSEDSADTTRMMQMASTPMTAPAVEPKDDLAELRHRLTDRPFQAPELGQLKPANSGSPGRDGWIRF